MFVKSDTVVSESIAALVASLILLFSITVAILSDPRLHEIPLLITSSSKYEFISETSESCIISVHKFENFTEPISFRACSLFALSLKNKYGYPLSFCVWEILINSSLALIFFFLTFGLSTSFSYILFISISSRYCPYSKNTV